MMFPEMSDQLDPSAREEAAAWHARLLTLAVTNEELDRFYAWREVPANAHAFDAIDGIWTRSAGLADDPDIAARLRGLRGERRSFWRRLLGGLGLTGGRAWVAAALMCLAVVAIAITIATRPVAYRTGVGERLVVRLEDGSRITLNTSSEVRVRLSGGARDVDLERGQVLFEVAHDALRPFTVRSPDLDVTALGTVFEVRSEGRRSEVMLVSGRVAVTPVKTASVMRLERPGAFLETPGDRRVLVGRRDPAIATSWVSGKIDLRDVPLDQAIAEMNRYSSRRIILDGQAEAQTRISGAFVTGDPDAFVAAVEALMPLRASRTDDGDIHLTERR